MQVRKTLAVAATAVVSTVLAAPATAAVSHTIQPGETLSGIAALLTPGGVHTSGLGHWCARPHDGCVNPAGRPTVIRPVVDPTPTVKRRRRPVVDVHIPEVDAS